MKKYTLGLLKETKTPPDRRAAITPSIGKEILKKFPEVELCVQSSELRAFKDSEYKENGIGVTRDLKNCDFLVGVKEVKIDTLIPGKTYMFFAHVGKKQPYNKPLLKAIIDKKITLIDYEYLTDENGMRLVAFGKWAGVVGAYNGLRAWGLKTSEFELQPAHEYIDKSQMFENCDKQQFKPLKIIITGGGRVAHGAMETLNAFGIKEVSPKQILEEKFNEPVFAKIEPWDYVKHKNNKEFDLQHFFDNPTEYVSTFEPYTKIADLYIACHFWDPKSPEFITKEQAKASDFNIKVIADVSCDIKKPIASTLRSSSIANPFYDYNPQTQKEEPAFSSDKNISVMAIDNLPGELPRDASEDFSKVLIDKIFPHLFNSDQENIINRATIVKNGSLTEKFKYLNAWVNS